ncbi:MAG: hypothetical protein AAGF20_08615 [Pseudomonadota bacterium]
MFRLFKSDEADLPQAYHEVWVEFKPRRIIEHWGMLGEAGDTLTHRIKFFRSLEDQIEDLLGPARDLGFKELDEADYGSLVLTTDAHEADAESLEERCHEALGWTGLGHVRDVSDDQISLTIHMRVLRSDLARPIIVEIASEVLAGKAFQISEE